MKRVLVQQFSCIWSVALLSLSGLFLILQPTPALAACASPETDYGTVTSTVDVSLAGNYRIWSRVSNPADIPSSYFLEIDGGDCFHVGEKTYDVDAWTWIDYQNGNEDSKIDVDLAAGSHEFKMIGDQDGVKLDRLLLLPDDDCTPTGTGDSCLEVSLIPGDVNGDDVVNVFDLSAILGNWSQSGVTRAQGDLNNDGVVNVFDLSVVLMNWGQTK